MSISVEKQGKTVQEAVELALIDLKVDISDVEIKVVDEGGKGFLGFKSKMAKVIVSVDESKVENLKGKTYDQNDSSFVETSGEEYEDGDEESDEDGDYADEVAVKFLLDVFNKMNIKVSFNVQVFEDEIQINVHGDDVGIVIGRRGETLDALQYLTNLAVNRKGGIYKRIILDVENYREKRNETLVKLAHRMASQAIKSGRDVMLEPMNPAERRVIHSTLQTNNRIETVSVGEDPNRRIVIKMK